MTREEVGGAVSCSAKGSILAQHGEVHSNELHSYSRRRQSPDSATPKSVPSKTGVHHAGEMGRGALRRSRGRARGVCVEAAASTSASHPPDGQQTKAKQGTRRAPPFARPHYPFADPAKAMAIARPEKRNCPVLSVPFLGQSTDLLLLPPLSLPSRLRRRRRRDLSSSSSPRLRSTPISSIRDARLSSKRNRTASLSQPSPSPNLLAPVRIDEPRTIVHCKVGSAATKVSELRRDVSRFCLAGSVLACALPPCPLYAVESASRAWQELPCSALASRGPRPRARSTYLPTRTALFPVVALISAVQAKLPWPAVAGTDHPSNRKTKPATCQHLLFCPPPGPRFFPVFSTPSLPPDIVRAILSWVLPPIFSCSRPVLHPCSFPRHACPALLQPGSRRARASDDK
ncbi:hypothetical protein PCL_06065 [Purpureocillium lilacinum]|uniref:Uncharacterized protein n=1 Tax=Purpureocillium lilacinum TaxID=33203 RepID=A0A2U3ELL3_PURLI|nr:hypothetical protein Purlil1_9095 [Purpureocillium lilacinum]PWI75407.1 hypothetical protein PCL_06065 [Purpureocillium lilacinum]